MTIPDAPWIRETERDGMPPYDDPDTSCPVCGREHCETIYTDKFGEVVGCDECLTLWEPDEWHAEHDRRGDKHDTVD